MNRKIFLEPPRAKKASRKEPSTEKKSSGKEIKNFHDAVQVTHLRRADEFMVLQHVIRRFKLRHEVDFKRLVEFREGIDRQLRSTLSEGMKDESIRHTHAQLLFCCMRLLDSQENLRRLEVGGMNWALPALAKDLEEVLVNDFMLNIDCFDVDELAKTVYEFGPSIADINRRLNYTRYYSLLGLTSYISGKKLYKQYMDAKFRRHHLRRYIEPSLVNQEAIWLFSTESDLDDDFSVLTQTTCSKPIRSSNNVQIFGGSQHSIMIDGHRLENRLVLSVPTNETPDRIDDALREFRAALKEEYVLNFGAYANVSTDDFDKSIFMTQFTHAPCFINDWDQIQRHIVGLWSWDVACLGETPIELACEQVMNDMYEVKKLHQHGLPIYDGGTLHGYYESTAKFIGTCSQKTPLKATKLDQFVTRSSIRLGTAIDAAI